MHGEKMMRLLRVAVAQNRTEDIVRLKEHLTRFGSETDTKITFAEFFNGADIASDYQSCYDIVFLDVALPLLGGLPAAKQIRSLDKYAVIILTADSKEYAMDGYTVGALGYLLKPVTFSDVSQIMHRASEKVFGRKTSYMFVPTEKGVKRLSTCQILYIESYSHKMKLKTATEEFMISGVMKELESSLSDKCFFRIAKSYLINLRYVDAVEGDRVFIGDKDVNLRRGTKRMFMKALRCASGKRF